VAGESRAFDSERLLKYIKFRRGMRIWRWTLEPFHALMWCQLGRFVIPVFEKIKKRPAELER
jgi:hypothetical protein